MITFWFRTKNFRFLVKSRKIAFSPKYFLSLNPASSFWSYCTLVSLAQAEAAHPAGAILGSPFILSLAISIVSSPVVLTLNCTWLVGQTSLIGVQMLCPSCVYSYFHGRSLLFFAIHKAVRVKHSNNHYACAASEKVPCFLSLCHRTFPLRPTTGLGYLCPIAWHLASIMEVRCPFWKPR